MKDSEAFEILSELGDLVTETPMNIVDPEISDLFLELESLVEDVKICKTH